MNQNICPASRDPCNNAVVCNVQKLCTRLRAAIGLLADKVVAKDLSVYSYDDSNQPDDPAAKER